MSSETFLAAPLRFEVEGNPWTCTKEQIKHELMKVWKRPMIEGKITVLMSMCDEDHFSEEPVNLKKLEKDNQEVSQRVMDCCKGVVWSERSWVYMLPSSSIHGNKLVITIMVDQVWISDWIPQTT